MPKESSSTHRSKPEGAMNRRRFMAYCSAAGFSATLFPGVLWSQVYAAEDGKISAEMVAHAARIAGLEFTPKELEAVAKGLRGQLNSYEDIREFALANDVAPAFQFNPILPGMTFSEERHPLHMAAGPIPERPAHLEDAAFWPVTKLSRALKAGRIRSLELTQIYLQRLKRFGPVLECVISLTEERALAQARKADEEIAAGRYLGPLHGIPWGAKDLLATKAANTTWGAMPYKDQQIDADATVIQRLDAAGAVLVAKLTLGALANGDVWYGGRTRNPWDVKRGSSGSSAGPAAATAAGLVAFAIGTETNGSIVSPSATCGLTGLRPTFGRVSRSGAMALSWTMDKLGPMCRSVEDCALVLAAIVGPDGHDPTVVDLPFNWSGGKDIKTLKIGYVKEAFKEGSRDIGHHQDTLAVFKSLGVGLIPVTLPDFPLSSFNFILTTEAAAAFDLLTRENRDDLMVRQDGLAWPQTFRRSRFVPAVEYIQANRVRRLMMEAMGKVMDEIDVYLTPPMHELLMTNLTGHPMAVVPNGFNRRGLPTSIGFVGGLYGEEDLLSVAKAYQDATDFHRQIPTMAV